MTVPGKGGRPRKWRSDADRVRAYRARQTGVDEPPVLAQALDDGDELAQVWATVRDLGEQLATANATIKQLRRERGQTRRELEREQHRWGWIESHNTELTVERERLETERDALTVELIEIRERLARLQQAAAAPVIESRLVAAPPQLPRAQRRQQQRQDRRHGS